MTNTILIEKTQIIFHVVTLCILVYNLGEIMLYKSKYRYVVLFAQ